ncbi:hypothetical protein [Methylomonas sp. TEB]|uniref:hypothetical protein n=1 Tax=Methylomonas sp. TEB TaxID=3398229 RepID=UPI0039F550D5
MKKSSNKIPFGLHKDILVDVSGVKSGLSCNCVCPFCFRKLQANKGSKRDHYFSHDPNEHEIECEFSFETLIHLMAKQIIEKHNFIVLPELKISMSMEDDDGVNHSEEVQVFEETNLMFSRVVLEQRLGEIRPDIIGYTEGQQPFLIEIAVTNFSSSQKKQKIRSLALPAIEIDLSDVRDNVTENELTEYVIKNSEKKKWLSNPKAVQAKKDLEEKLKAKIDEENKKIANRIISLQSTSSQKPNKTIFVVRDKKSTNSLGGINHYDPRWFVCEACRYLFSKSLIEAPYLISTIQCPECGFDVLTST